VPVTPGGFLDNTWCIALIDSLRAKELRFSMFLRPILTRTLAAASAVVGVCALATLQVSASNTAPSSKKTPSAASHSSAKPKSAKSKRTSGKGKRGKRGQQKIDAERTHQIQEALIRQHYLQGEPSGKWDASTEAALRKFQADNGWQSKTVPDSRALIRLGLGPNHDHLLNPESAMTSTPETPSTNSTPAALPVPAGASPTANQPQQ
jgi:peptidoglycan hydrolase-like protein with peptidoglycan-binding domain